MSQHVKPNAQHGRRPPKGAFPACPESGICRAQSVRTHSACRNCAVSNVSLAAYLARYGTNKEKYQKIMMHHTVCGDLLTRVIESFQGSHDNPDFEKIVLILYAMFGKGNIASRADKMVFEEPNKWIIIDLEELHKHLKEKKLQKVYLQDLISELEWNIVLPK